MHSFKPEEVELIRKTAAPNASKDELELFLYRAECYKLNPLLNEILFIKDHPNAKPTIYISRDGYLKIAHASGKLNGMKSFIVEDEKGNLIKAVAIVFHKDMQYPVEYEVHAKYYLNERKPSHQSAKATMLIKAAELGAFKRAFGVSSDDDDIISTQQTSEPSYITLNPPQAQTLPQARISALPEPSLQTQSALPLTQFSSPTISKLPQTQETISPINPEKPINPEQPTNPEQNPEQRTNSEPSAPPQAAQQQESSERLATREQMEKLNAIMNRLHRERRNKMNQFLIQNGDTLTFERAEKILQMPIFIDEEEESVLVQALLDSNMTTAKLNEYLELRYGIRSMKDISKDIFHDVLNYVQSNWRPKKAI